MFGTNGAYTIAATGLPLGLFCSGKFTSINIRLEAGDVLLLYSDGLIESENSRREAYGIERLRASLPDVSKLSSAEGMVQACMNNLSKFLNGDKPNDDLTLVAIRRTGSSS